MWLMKSFIVVVVNFWFWDILRFVNWLLFSTNPIYLSFFFFFLSDEAVKELKTED